MTTTNTKTMQLVILGLMTGILLLMAYTPLGYLNIGPLAITFNMIPVAVCAIVLGPVGGGIAGAVFGLTSFLQCIGIGGTSPLGSVLFGINPFFSAIQCFVPRILDGVLIAYIFRGVKEWKNTYTASAVTGFFAAFFNTVFFMTALVTLFGNTEYMQGLMGGKNVIVFICTFVGINAVFEMIASTMLTAVVAGALYKAKVIPVAVRAGAKA
ncbi:MAG: ECF transporter S component [Clostridiales bacterium]|nr:ECF transporter S component [Clostridiales bacterium]